MFEIKKIILCITLGMSSTEDFYLLVRQDSEYCFIKTDKIEVESLNLPIDTQYVAVKPFKNK
jgi:hypothetical protein